MDQGQCKAGPGCSSGEQSISQIPISAVHPKDGRGNSLVEYPPMVGAFLGRKRDIRNPEERGQADTRVLLVFEEVTEVAGEALAR